MEFITWALNHLPIPVAVTVVVVGLISCIIRIFSETTWKGALQSKLFIFPSLVCIYTLIFSISLISYTKYDLVAGEVGKKLIPLVESSVDKKLVPLVKSNLRLSNGVKEMRLEFLNLALVITKRQIKSTRFQLYQNLNLQNEYRAKGEPVPDFLPHRQATLKGDLDSFEQEIQEINKRRQKYFN